LTVVAGVLQGFIDLRSPNTTPQGAPIVGGVIDDGTLVVGGTLTQTQQLRDWHLTRVGNTLVGSGNIDDSFINPYGPLWTRKKLTDMTLR
jgi:hypothetical protein